MKTDMTKQDMHAELLKLIGPLTVEKQTDGLVTLELKDGEIKSFKMMYVRCGSQTFEVHLAENSGHALIVLDATNRLREHPSVKWIRISGYKTEWYVLVRDTHDKSHGHPAPTFVEALLKAWQELKEKSNGHS